MKRRTTKSKTVRHPAPAVAADDHYDPVPAAALFDKWRKDPEFRREYEALADEFALYEVCPRPGLPRQGRV